MRGLLHFIFQHVLTGVGVGGGRGDAEKIKYYHIFNRTRAAAKLMFYEFLKYNQKHGKT